MALLSLCLEQGYDVVAAHVNYRLRETADRDEQIVTGFCREKGIRVYTDYPIQKEKGNFQNWAREVRYDFYQKIYEKEGCRALLLGHQKDDNVENYLMALERHSRSWYYGIRRESFHHGMKIIRPLLKVRKRQTREYCLANGIPFGDDETNFTDRYSRNRVRHQLVETADDEQIEQWCRQISEFNAKQQGIIDYIESTYHKEPVSLEKYAKEDAGTRHLILRHLLSRYLADSPSEDFIRETDRALISAGRNIHIRLSERYVLYLDYGEFYVCDMKETYQYWLQKGQHLKTPYFEIAEEGELIERIGVNEDEWPLLIRPAEDSDSILLRYGTKKLSRFFIDRKIPHGRRRLWPVVLNCRGEVIFVPAIGCERNHFCSTDYVYMLK
ncbi:MAG: tRNA lysidine(34) synthetase TilS [Erysipelotrichaceae bacterium]|nr:tRNA lysidine(34) synthetase TilS [Erysipelotrichaceae bacterium]